MKRNSKVLNQIFNSGVDPVKPVNPPRPIPTKYPPRREDEQPVRKQSDEKPSKSFKDLLEEEIEKNKANSSRRTNMSKSIKSESDRLWWNINNGYLTDNEIIKIQNMIDDYVSPSNRYITHGDIKGYYDGEISPGEASDMISTINEELLGLSYRLSEYRDADDTQVRNGDFDDFVPMFEDTERICKEYLTEKAYSELYNDVFKDFELLFNREGVNSSRQPIKSGTSNFGSNDNVFGYSFPLVTYIAENYMYDEETDSETEERDYDADDWEYRDAIDNAKDLADEMNIPQYDDYSEPYLCYEPFMIKFRDGYYEGLWIEVKEGTDETPYDENGEYQGDFNWKPFTDEEMNKFADKLNEYFNRLCSEYGWQKLGISARFSNGETWYTKIDNSKKPVKSALNLEDTAQANVANNFNSKIFDYTWFDATKSDTTNYDLFIEDFTQWLIENGVNVNEYPNMDFDVGYYFKEFMNDPDANTTNAEAMYQQVQDWLTGEEEFMTSDQYLDDMYGNTYFTDNEFFTQDIDENARKQFQYGDTHGFKSAQDLAKAARECLNYLECYDMYDAGGMGYHAYDENNEWFETGCLFLGNGEEEWQLDPDVPFDEEYDYANAYSYFCINHGCMYAVSDRLYAYGIKWSDIEQKGDELGLRSGM